MNHERTTKAERAGWMTVAPNILFDKSVPEFTMRALIRRLIVDIEERDRELLRQAGRHDATCRVWFKHGYPCDCGARTARALIEEEP